MSDHKLPVTLKVGKLSTVNGQLSSANGHRPTALCHLSTVNCQLFKNGYLKNNIYFSILKRTAAILLMGLLLFNWFGYRVFISCMQDKAGLQLEARLDNEKYDESKLLSIKVPAVHLSAYSLSGQFERTNGQVEIKGVQYKYVRKRIFNDSLEYICIANHSGMKLEHAKDEIFKQVNDLQHNAQGKKSDAGSLAFKNFTTDYYTFSDLFQLNRFSCLRLQNRSAYLVTLSSAFLSIAEQPPECIC